MDDYVGRLAEYRNQKGIPHPASRPIDHYLSMTSADFRRCSHEELQDMHFDLSAYAYYLQDLHNRQVARLEYCHDLIERAVGGRLHQFEHVFGNKEKWLIAIMSDPDVKKLHAMECELKGVVQTTAGLANQLNFVAKSVNNALYRRDQHHG